MFAAKLRPALAAAEARVNDGGAPPAADDGKKKKKK
jgi:hypothetical protein